MTILHQTITIKALELEHFYSNQMYNVCCFLQTLSGSFAVYMASKWDNYSSSLSLGATKPQTPFLNSLHKKSTLLYSVYIKIVWILGIYASLHTHSSKIRDTELVSYWGNFLSTVMKCILTFTNYWYYF